MKLYDVESHTEVLYVVYEELEFPSLTVELVAVISVYSETDGISVLYTYNMY